MENNSKGSISIVEALLQINIRPVWALVSPLLAALLILFSGKQRNLREGWTLLGGLCLGLAVLSMTSHVLASGPIRLDVFTMLPGVEFGFTVDAPGLIFATTASCLWLLVSIYAIGYMRSTRSHAQTRFYFCFALALFGAVGVAFAANLVTLFIFYEILTLSTYPLVSHEGTPEALNAGHKYLAYLLGGGVLLLLGILMVYALTGTTDFKDGGILLPVRGAVSETTLVIVFLCFLVGFAKAAWMPVHSWLPAAMVAPTPVSALLHAVAVVKAGIFGIIRMACHIYGMDLMQALGLGLVLGAVATFTIVAANLCAIGQDNLKRLLAYSTINQLSFILLGVAILSPTALTGALLHIPFHGVMKITLFLCAGAMAAVAGKKAVSEMAGLGRAMPVTAAAFSIGALGMCGAPPLAGFISKWHVALGAVDSGQLFFLFIICIGSLLDVVYFFPVIRTAFFGTVPLDETLDLEREAKVPVSGGNDQVVEHRHRLYLLMLIPLAITAAFSILFCLFPNMLHLYDLARQAASHAFGGQ